MCKYHDEDLEVLYKNGEDINELASKYKVSRNAVIKALNRRGINLRRKKIIIRTPYKEAVVKSLQECADTLQLSTQTIRNALKGKKVRVLNELEITLEVVEND